ncbi:MAG: hypothetical protein HYT64_02235 [Candidatus Yanofskybacteria bacterium]|nr:hypothetical protein [Candidatus Yanofskybacteria bacterium]
MDSADQEQSYDYLVTDSGGTRKVINGVEYPVTEDDLPKEHKNSGCTECSFVQDQETLFVYLVPRDLKEKATNKPLFVGNFTMPGWTDHSGFYLFGCKSCGQTTVDYPHGYTNFGLMYLRCDDCGEKLPLEVTEERAIYEREDVYIPKPKREDREKELREIMMNVEKRGVRVIVPGLNERSTVSNDSWLRRSFWNVGIILLALWTLGILLAQKFRILN